MNLIIKRLEKNPSDANKLDIDTLEKLIIKSRDTYHNGIAIISDELYDTLIEILEHKDSKNKLLKQVGAPVTNNKSKEKLLYLLPSLDKFKNTTTQLDNWLKKYNGPYLISDKLDGISGMLVINNNKMTLFTRGDGEYGINISHIIPYLQIPMKIENCVVRGEIIISKENFKKLEKEKTVMNARNTVSGLVNSKKADIRELKLLDFICYEMLSEHNNLTFNEQINKMKEMGLNTVHKKLLNEISHTILMNYYEKRREIALYDIDGIVIIDNNLHKKSKTLINPKYAFAYKILNKVESKEVKIKEVQWNISKDKLLIPKIIIEPVKLSSVMIENVAAFNAKYIIDNQIGPGSIVEITRSGDVIPYILKVIKTSKVKLPIIPHKWDKNKVNFIVDDTIENKEIDKEVLLKNLVFYFKTLDIKGIDTGTLVKIVNYIDDENNNFVKILDKIYKLKIKDLLEIDTFKEKSATKIFNSIHDNNKFTIEELMTASNKMGHGLGIKKISGIVKEYDILNKKISLDDITKLKGYEETTAKQFIDNLDNFKEFYKVMKKHIIIKEIKKNKTSYFTDQIVVFSGVRDKDLENKIESSNGKVSGSVSKNTTLLIVKDKDENSSKILKAKELGIKIISLEDAFKK